MKILYVFDKMPTTYQQYLMNLLEAIKVTLNIKTLAYSKNGNPDYYVNSYGLKDSFQRIIFKFKLSKFKSSQDKIYNRFDIIHVQHSFLFSKITPLLKFQNRPKIIITLRGADSYLKPWVDKRWRNFYLDYGNKIDAFITMSNHQKEYLKKWGVNENKIHVIPISFGPFSTTFPKYPSKDKLKLVSAFRMTWEKNIDGTIHLARLLKEKSIPFIYDIYGDGHDLGQLYYLIDRYDLAEYISVKGKIENDLLKQLLVNYDFFVQLSISEALSSSVLEAQSVGMPCILSNSDGLKEAAVVNKTALIADYNEIEWLATECVSLWRNPEKYYSFSANAIEFVNSNFTLEHEKERLEALYQSLK